MSPYQDRLLGLVMLANVVRLNRVLMVKGLINPIQVPLDSLHGNA